MKTAMKKLFSLVLVAVLLVGVMPFQAFAEGDATVCTYCGEAGHTVNEHCSLCGVFGHDADAHCTHCGEFGHAVDAHCTHCGEFGHDVDAHCTHCGELGHAADAHCTHCGEFGHAVDAHCSTCGELECICSADVEVPKTKAVLKQGSQETPREEDRSADWSTTVEQILIHWFEGDPSQFSNAYIYRTDRSKGTVGLSDVVKAGDEVHIRLKEVASTPDPKTCDICGGEVTAVVVDGTTLYMCNTCSMDEDSCTCGQTTPPVEDTKNQVTITLDYNYWGAKDGSWKAEKGDLLRNVVGVIPAPTRDGHQFKYWTTDEAGKEIIDENCKAKVTKNGLRIFAQWSDNLAVGGWYTIRVDLNYGHKMGDPVTNIVRGTRMSAVLDNIPTPTRWEHKFVGWYWDSDYKYPVDGSDRVTKNDVIFAKWEKRNTNNEIILKIYLNGNTRTVDKVVDMYDYSGDGEISWGEVEKVVKKYYTARNSKGMDIDGLYGTESWSRYVNSYNHLPGYDEIKVARHDDTVIYVMVDNAKDRPASSSSSSSSSGTADSTNPKTGDMIFTAATVLVASASCLAALYYLNKKRAY